MSDERAYMSPCVRLFLRRRAIYRSNRRRLLRTALTSVERFKAFEAARRFCRTAVFARCC